MKKFLKFLGAAALIAGFTPYQISGDKETGSVKVKALLWQLTSKPGAGGGKTNIDINFGLASSAEEEETDLFSDELTVDYCHDGYAVDEDNEEPDEIEEPEEAPELEEIQEPEEPAEPETPEEA